MAHLYVFCKGGNTKGRGHNFSPHVRVSGNTAAVPINQRRKDKVKSRSRRHESDTQDILPEPRLTSAQS
jgi:hypothetical protein